jgi:hypothetical protein
MSAAEDNGISRRANDGISQILHGLSDLFGGLADQWDAEAIAERARKPSQEVPGGRVRPSGRRGARQARS